MSGFAKVVLRGKAGSQEIINVLWYRSDDWVPLVDLAIVTHLDVLTQAVIDHVWPALRDLLTDDYSLKDVTAVPYDGSLVEVAPGGFTRTVNEAGTQASDLFDTFGHTANIRFFCGPLVDISGIGVNKRNRGYFALGPIGNAVVTNEGDLVDAGYVALINVLADKLDDTLFSLWEAVSFIPIRVHHKRTLGINTGMAYSDILGYALPNKTGYRRSRTHGA